MGGSVMPADCIRVTARRASFVACVAPVHDRKEADAIRKGIDPLDFTSIGQRTRFRVAAVQIP